MKNYTIAKELMHDPDCANCGKTLTGEDVVALFQTDKGEDILEGYFCEDCSDRYDENGELE